nr:retrovirus-related Pol polyprotein from transposon TNT 1-94 [Tanacetum cinerariifolium]
SVNGKKYILVTIDDYSRFTWVKFLRSKDETLNFIIKFLKMIQEVGISHETSVARSSQQNGVLERRNRTLIKGARTMLIYAQAPLFLWEEAVAIACFTQNRSIIRLRHGKTPYEFLHSKLHDLSFFYVFGALCYPINDSENLVQLEEPNLSASTTIVEVPKELPKVSMVNSSLKKLKFHLASFDMVVKESTTATAITEGTWGFEHTKACFRDDIIPFVKALKELINSFDQFLIDELTERNNSFSEQSAPTFDQLFEINDLKAQSQEKDTVIMKLKERLKSLSGNVQNGKIKRELEEIETINIELDHRVTKLVAENEHLKQTYKNMYDSIKSLRVQSKEQCDDLIKQVNIKLAKNSNLNASLQEKVLIIAALKETLSRLKGKAVVNEAVSLHSIDPELLKIDVEPLAPKLRNNKIAHTDYLRHTQEETTTLREIVKSERLINLLNTSLDYALPLKEPIPIASNTDKPVVTLIYSRKSKVAKKKVPVCNLKINKSLVVQIVLWYLDSGCSKHMTGDRSQLINFVQKFLGTVKFRNDHVAKIMGYGDYKIGNVTISRVYFVEGLRHNLFLAFKTKSWLWHHRLSHLNFGAINHLDRQGLVRVLSKLKFEKDHLCSACAMGRQNGVVEIRNRTLIKAVCTMLIYAQALLFLWAEALATACFTQNRSIIRLRHRKTPYELLHNKLPDLSYLYVFGALCYPKNDSDNLGKLQSKADIGIFIGYAQTKKAFRIYNRRTRRIVETIHVDFDELTAMASEQNSSGPALNEMTPATISSGLVQKSSSSTPYVPPLRNDWDLLFQSMFDELLNPPSSVDHEAAEVIALIPDCWE